ncbi:MAG: polysaccharide biosynthesis/export family protein [Fuerstiella sp.]
MPCEFTAPDRSIRRTIDLSVLRQNPPREHLVDGGDILGIYIEGVLGNADTPPPVYVPADPNTDPSVGYPIRVDMDGTISLPMLDPMPVRGLTTTQVRQIIRNAYTHSDQAVLQPGQDHIHVTLQKPRTHRIIVIREESGNQQGNRGPANVVNFEIDKRGTGRVVHLPAHQNDVLHALTLTGGLPGLDADNVIYIIRGQQAQANRGNRTFEPQAAYDVRQQRQQAPMTASRISTDVSIEGPKLAEAQQMPAGAGSYRGHSVTPVAWQQYTSMVPTAPGALQLQQHLQPQYAGTLNSSRNHNLVHYSNTAMPPIGASQIQNQPGNWAYQNDESVSWGPPENIIRIPLKVYPGEQRTFQPEDIILYDGDIVLVENRVTEFFYTAGLLGGGQLALPRDYDIGIMDAIALAETQNRRTLSTTAIGGASVLNQDVTVGASRVIVQRKMPGGSFLPIEINLYDVMKNPGGQILIRPEDRIILRYTRIEACLAFFERFFIDGLVNGTANSISGQN